MTTIDDWLDVAAITPDLPDSKLLQVLTLIDRLPAGERPKPVLEAMRPRLADLRPPRRMTIQRLLFKPMEDLFDPPEVYQRRIGRLSRRTIRTCWALFMERADQRLITDIDGSLAGVASNDWQQVNALGALLWPHAAAILADVIGEASTDRRLGVRWFGRDDDTWRQVDDFASILTLGIDIEEIKSQLPPRPIDLLTESQTELIQKAVPGVALKGARSLQTLVLVLAARMSRPADLLDILEGVKADAIPDKEAFVKQMESAMVETLVRQAQSLEIRADQKEGAVSLARQAESLVAGLVSLQAKLDRKGNSATTDRLRVARTEIGKTILSAVVRNADRTMAEMLDGLADLDEGFSDSRANAAEEYALALRRCSLMASHVGIERQVTSKLEAVRQDLWERGLAPRDDTTIWERDLVQSVRLAELVAGPEDAETLLKKGLRRIVGR